MKPLNDLLPKALSTQPAKSSLQVFSPKHLPARTEVADTTQPFEISVYSGTLTPEVLVKRFNELQEAFPNLSAGFITVLSNRIKELNFDDARLTDAINHLIDTCQYPNHITPAHILAFDKKVKFYTYSQILEIQNKTGRAFDDYGKIKRGNRMFWVSLADIEQYHIQSD